MPQLLTSSCPPACVSHWLNPADPDPRVCQGQKPCDTEKVGKGRGTDLRANRLQTSTSYSCTLLANLSVLVNCLLTHPAAQAETWEASFPSSATSPRLLHQPFPGVLPPDYICINIFLVMSFPLLPPGSLQQLPACHPAPTLVFFPSVLHAAARMLFCKLKSDRVIPLIKTHPWLSNPGSFA